MVAYPLDPSYHIIGYPLIPKSYNPFFDDALKQEDREVLFNRWVTGYFSHGDTLDTLEKRTVLLDPPPTITKLTSEDVIAMTHPPPGKPDGSDSILLRSGIRLGVFADNRRAALLLGDEVSREQPIPGARSWRDVELRYVTCGQSIWETTYGLWLLRAEIAEAHAKGMAVRDVSTVIIKHGNHFVCEPAIAALLAC